MIHYIENGNIFNSNADILVNPVNCVGVMGKGLALEFKKRYPQMFESYKLACNNNLVKIGEPHVWSDFDITIINFPTKIHWRDKSELKYIIEGMKFLKEYLEIHDSASIAISALGCGLGGLPWYKVENIIETSLRFVKNDVYLYLPNK